MAQEKRSERRLPVNMILNKYINGEPHACRAVNLSRGGILLKKLFEPDLPHHQVVLEFQLPGTDVVIRAEGMALMDGTEARSVGVRFTRMAPEAVQMIDRFLSSGGRMVEAVEERTERISARR